MSKLAEIVKGLPLDLQQEVEDFARFLLRKYGPDTEQKLSGNWLGAPSESEHNQPSPGSPKKISGKGDI